MIIQKQNKTKNSQNQNSRMDNNRRHGLQNALMHFDEIIVYGFSMQQWKISNMNYTYELLYEFSCTLPYFDRVDFLFSILFEKHHNNG